KEYHHLTMPLSSAVYDCWGSSGIDFNLPSRGIEDMKGLFPDVEYLKLAWPRLVWSDASPERPCDFNRFNINEGNVLIILKDIFPSLKFLVYNYEEKRTIYTKYLVYSK